MTSQAARKVITTVGITYEVGGRYTACQHSFQCRVPAEQTLPLLVRELYTKLSATGAFKPYNPHRSVIKASEHLPKFIGVYREYN